MTVIAVKRRERYAEVVNLNVWECPVCGIVYGIPTTFADSVRSSGAHYYCPNGDSLSWEENDITRAQKSAKAAERRAILAEEAARYQRERADAAERSRNAVKGHLTRIKNRIAAGVCPVPGCKRTGLVQTMRHIATKHPTWHAEHANELTAR